MGTPIGESLRRIEEELARIRTAANLEKTERAEPTVPARDLSDACMAVGRQLVRERSLRTQYFTEAYFGEPAWDMMLDLYMSSAERRRVSVSSLCIAARVPPTTALRWIKLLEDDGTIIRVHDPSDGRRVFVVLSEPAEQRVRHYLEGVIRSRHQASAAPD